MQWHFVAENHSYVLLSQVTSSNYNLHTAIGLRQQNPDIRKKKKLIQKSNCKTYRRTHSTSTWVRSEALPTINGTGFVGIENNLSPKYNNPGKHFAIGEWKVPRLQSCIFFQ